MSTNITININTPLEPTPCPKCTAPVNALTLVKHLIYHARDTDNLQEVTFDVNSLPL